MFENYKGSYEGFESFNTKVLNMPRHGFESMKISFVKALAEILDMIYINDNEEIMVKELYFLIHNCLKERETFRIPSYITQLFDFDLITEEQINSYYEIQGRKFRHLAEIMKLWGLIDNAENSQKITINKDVCKEFFKIDEKTKQILRTKLLAMDIEDNSLIQSLKNIKEITREGKIFSYKPAINILRYMKEIDRAVSKFELCNLLAVILPECDSSEMLYKNAIDIGKMLPANVTSHEKFFFDYMNWKYEDGQYFRYSSSQEPHFKFNSFLLFLEDLELIKRLENEAFVLTTYSEELLKEDIPAEVVELERYINIAEKDYTDRELVDLIIHNIKPSLLKYASQNESFIHAMNMRALKNPKYDGKGKKVRNRLIAELAKVKAEYTCQISNKDTFKDKKGNNYVESHHIIEFNSEDGPDIVENLLVISPLYHSLLHHGSSEAIHDLYDHIRKNNIITIDTFKEMADNYGCIEEKHIRYLLQKRLISKIEYDELLEYIA